MTPYIAPITTEIYITVTPHPSDKRPGYNVIATRVIKSEKGEIESSVVLNRFRRVKSDPKHRLQEANDYALSIAKIFGVMDVRILSKGST